MNRELGIAQRFGGVLRVRRGGQKIAAEGKEERCPRQLLRHPGALHELVEAILGDAALHDERRGMVELELAVQLPESVAQER